MSEENVNDTVEEVVEEVVVEEVVIDYSSVSKSGEVFENMKTIFGEMEAHSEKWFNKNTKSASAKMRKCTIALDRLGKEFRKESVAECKD